MRLAIEQAELAANKNEIPVGAVIVFQNELIAQAHNQPCLMCAGAIMNARISRVFFGAFDPKTGVAGSVLNVFGESKLNHHTDVQGGILGDECAHLLKTFFRNKRSNS